MAEAPLTFVGREPEMRELSQAVDQAREGSGGLWFISGEQGIGKSRLAEEAAAVARERGMRVFWGQSWEAGGAPAYWPWIQALRALFRTAAPGQYEVHRTALAQFLPDVAPNVPADDLGLEPAQARFRLMDAVRGMLAEAAEQWPLLIVLEDLHAADESSVLLVEFLANLTHDQPLIILATLRPPPAKGTMVTSHLLRALQSGTHLPLQRLSSEEVAAFARATGAALDEERTRMFHETTEGHPLFMVEVARLWRSQPPSPSGEAPPVPYTVRAAIEERLTKLSPACRLALSQAAIVGREFELGLLRASFGEPQQGWESVVGEAVEASMLVDVTPERFRFSHFLMREVLYDGLQRDDRDSGHRRVADALGECLGSDGEPRWSEIAHHLSAVGPEVAGEAAGAYRNSGARSLAQFAFGDAVAAYARALECSSAANPSHETEEIELMIELGHAQMRAGQVRPGKKTCLQAADRARALGEAELFARAALEHGNALLFAQIDEQLVQLLEESLKILDDTDSALRARVTARLAAARQPALDPEGPFAMARDAIGMARRVDDPQALLDTFRNGGSAFVDLGDPNERLALDAEHVALATRLGNRVETLRGTMRLVGDYWELGRMEEAHRAILSCDRVTERLGHGFYRWRSMALHAAEALWHGDADKAEEFIDEARRLGSESGDTNSVPVCRVQKLRLLKLLGDFDAQVPVIDRIDRSWHDLGIGGALMNAVIGAEHLAAGRVAAALQRYEPEAVETAVRARDRAFQFALAGLCVAAGDRDRAAVLYERAKEFEAQLVIGGALFLTIDAPMTLALAELADFLGHDDEARRYRESALDSAKRLGGAPLAREIEAGRTATLGVSARAVEQGPDRLTMESAGEYWLVRNGKDSLHLKDTKGVRILARLIDEPGREFHVLDLAGAPEAKDEVIDRGDAGEMIDQDARRSYQRRAEALRVELAEAEEWNDLERAERAREELDFLTQELARAVGLGGRTRRIAGAAERARVNVQRRIRDAIRRIEAQDPDLAKQLNQAVRTGAFCVYEPS